MKLIITHFFGKYKCIALNIAKYLNYLKYLKYFSF